MLGSPRCPLISTSLIQVNQGTGINRVILACSAKWRVSSRLYVARVDCHGKGCKLVKKKNFSFHH